MNNKDSKDGTRSSLTNVLERALQVFTAVATVFACYVSVLAFSRPETRDALAPIQQPTQTSVVEHVLETVVVQQTIPVIVPVEVTRELVVTQLIEVTRPVEVTRLIEVTREVTRIVEVTPSSTETPAPTPTSAVALPFKDDFDQGLRPEWRIMRGEPVVVDGQLRSAGGGDLTIDIGDDSWGDYTVEFDFAKFAYNWAYIDIARTVRFQAHHNTTVSWRALKGKDWVAIAPAPEVGSGGHLRLTVKGNQYSVFLNGDPNAHSTITYGTPVKGPLTITIRGAEVIDNLTITSP